MIELKRDTCPKRKYGFREWGMKKYSFGKSHLADAPITRNRVFGKEFDIACPQVEDTLQRHVKRNVLSRVTCAIDPAHAPFFVEDWSAAIAAIDRDI